MPSLFTKIILGELPAYKVAEDDLHLAFLDIRPMAKGHTLVIPKLEIDRFFDLQSDALAELMKFAQSVSIALEEVVDCNRVGVVVAGLEVPHAHVHLIPMHTMRDLSFDKPPLQFTSEDMQALAHSISAAWNRS